jgi:mono/diheme cytochrome c family protein
VIGFTWRRAAGAIAFSFGLLAADASRGDEPSAERGAYVFAAGGCYACHTDLANGGAALAGGGPLVSPFGTFYAPNITPHPERGIGRWSEAQFLRAMQEGRRPDGGHYYPAFPYPAYTKAAERDLADLHAYLATVPPSDRPSLAHELSFPFSIRPLVRIWKWLNFTKGVWRRDPNRDAAWNRGAYLVEALTHCGECHTPRNALGGLDRGRWMAGARLGAEQRAAPNLTPHATGLADWTMADIASALELGILPSGGGVFGGEMKDVVRHGTSRLTDEDRLAIAAYLKTLPPLPSAVPPKKE